MAGGDSSRGAKLRAASTITLWFAGIAFVTSMFMAVGTNKTAWKAVAKSGGVFGPIEVEEAGTVLLVEVRQPIKTDNVWSFVTGEVLDAEQEYLFSFGEELWRETGYDEGFWRETKDDFSTKVTMPEAGQFYLSFEAEASAPSVGGDVFVRVQKKAGSTVPLFAAGFLGVIGGLVMRAAASAMENTGVSV